MSTQKLMGSCIPLSQRKAPIAVGGYGASSAQGLLQTSTYWTVTQTENLHQEQVLPLCVPTQSMTQADRPAPACARATMFAAPLFMFPL